MGRRLAGGAAMMFGMFTFLESYVWECTSIPKAKIPDMPYAYQATVLFFLRTVLLVALGPQGLLWTCSWSMVDVGAG